MPTAASLHDWNFFDVPIISRSGQTCRVWGGKMRHGWPLIVRHVPSLLGRFVLGRLKMR
jgi:hypothetical protein